ncbi:hypothetical protein C8R45DRAFT_1098089 [Mycena sanguinolenta]|nr:hypothetical protein C8R45DRAFT_1098089 [Mycena sanguinolenta]
MNPSYRFSLPSIHIDATLLIDRSAHGDPFTTAVGIHGISASCLALTNVVALFQLLVRCRPDRACVNTADASTLPAPAAALSTPPCLRSLQVSRRNAPESISCVHQQHEKDGRYRARVPYSESEWPKNAFLAAQPPKYESVHEAHREYAGSRSVSTSTENNQETSLPRSRRANTPRALPLHAPPSRCTTPPSAADVHLVRHRTRTAHAATAEDITRTSFFAPPHVVRGRFPSLVGPLARVKSQRARTQQRGPANERPHAPVELHPRRLGPSSSKIRSKVVEKLN